MLCHKIGQPERGENLLESLLSEYHLAPEDYQQPGIAPYMVALKKKADIHWDLGNIDKAKEEYQEVLYILGNMHEFCPELSENVLAIEQEIKETLGASEVGGG